MCIRDRLHILAIELMCAARGIEFRSPLKTSDALSAVITALRSEVATLEEDRYIAKDITKAASLILSGLIKRAKLQITMPALAQ